MSRFYSFIIPVFDRPGEMAELLSSLADQTFKSFEVVIVEDGSSVKSDQVAASFSAKVEIRYFDQPKSGPSIARNFGMQQARGDYLIFVDSDCLLPPDYLKVVDDHLEHHPVDFFGGPDRAAGDFNRVQKAISYAMTSFLTTGGIRGGRKHVSRFHPRSFNMGISRRAWMATGGFPVTRMHPGEDMVFSIELIKAGFKAGLITDAYVYHKRRTSLSRFYRQVYGFGKTRLIISKVYPNTFRLFFVFPTLFVYGNLLLVAASILLSIALQTWWPSLLAAPLVVWMLVLFADASCRTASVVTGFKSLIASIIQMAGYGTGFLNAWYKAFVRGIDEYAVFTGGFYPDSNPKGR
jgi:glycosyltransferase involved in cell wall biosynthesis